MYSPKISDDLIPVLYKKAKLQRKPMTKLVDELIRSALEVKDQSIIRYKCSKCYSVIDADIDQDTAYCDICETIVPLERG